jgi:hypothetical protein
MTPDDRARLAATMAWVDRRIRVRNIVLEIRRLPHGDNTRLAELTNELIGLTAPSDEERGAA